MRRNYGAPTQEADLTECTIKNLLEKFPRRKRIGRNSQNCTEMRAWLSDCYRGGNSPRSCTFDSGVCRNQKHKNIELDGKHRNMIYSSSWPRINPKKYATLVRNYLFIYFSPMMMAGEKLFIYLFLSDDDGWGQLLHSGWQF